MDTSKRALSMAHIQQMQQLQNSNINEDKIKKHLETLSVDDPERILDQFLIDWQPIKRYPRLAIFNFLLFVIFCTFGSVQLAYTLAIKEQTFDYKSVCTSKGKNLGDICTLTDFEISQDMEGPVYVYYQMTNFFQASPEFSGSKSVDQLQGIDISTQQAKRNCGENYYTNAQMGKTLSFNGETLNPNDVAIPCGLFAYTYFNDTFSINGATIDESDIAWSIDIEENYRMKESLKSKAWMNLEDQHFMVWMRPSPASTFRKYYGKIKEGLNKGNYILTIKNNYDATFYKSSVSLVFTTLNAFGQKNLLGSCLLLSMSAIFLLSSIICLIKYYKAKDKY